MMMTKKVLLIFLFSMELMASEPLQSQNSKYDPIIGMDNICLRMNEKVDSINRKLLSVLSMNESIILDYQNKIKKLIETCKANNDNLVLLPLKYYYANSRQYLTRLSEFSKNTPLEIAPFQYNELKFQYMEMVNSRNALESAISYADLMKKMEKSVEDLGAMKSQLNKTLKKTQEKIDSNFLLTVQSINMAEKSINKSVDSTAVKMDASLKKNEKKLKLALGITGATGILSIAILVLTLVH